MKMFSKPDVLFADARPLVDRARLAQFADALAVAVALSLPWSTSATSILIALWLLVLLPTLEFSMLRRELISPAGGLPVVLWLLGALGMLWADVSWSERLAGLSGYHKLLLLPFVLAEFRRSGQANWVLLALLASCAVLLAVSFGLALIPGLPWRGNTHLGVPVKDYILQSELFALCAFGLLGLAAAQKCAHPQRALMLVVAALLFIANIVYVETARTTLVAMAVLLVLFGFLRFGWRGGLLACLSAALFAGAVWVSSPYLRQRVSQAVVDVQASDQSGAVSPVGLRLEFWRKSLDFLGKAPIVGHGTGSVPELFRRDATAQTNPMAITTNPHNQVFVVALDLGLAGTVVLLAMWIAHLRLFSREARATRSGQSYQSLLAWFGLTVVVENVVASMFNSHLFDFSQGWLYVWGVGVLGGSILHARCGPERQ